MFYAVDVPKLQSLYGSNDEGLLDAVLQQQAEELDENDEFFDGYELPIDSRTAMKQIFAGTVPPDKSLAAMYGYVLKTLCEHLGEFVGGDLYNTRILPIQTKLMENGPPIPIPDDPGNFPEIGYLTHEGLQTELEAAANPLPSSSPDFFKNMQQYTHHSLSEEELLEELDCYQEILNDLIATGLGVVAFRH